MMFQDRVSVITGASQGIGEAIALAFAREGATTVLVDIQSDLVGDGLDLIGRVAHRDTASGPVQHLDVVTLVAHGGGLPIAQSPPHVLVGQDGHTAQQPARRYRHATDPIRRRPPTR